ncbi:MAG: GNAT family N-acetyltransferase [Ekhidna sp.]|uniref:GNAT family N-acetyltransferase n=1 Tax=Ekhidna sp. TaxID=2608089 RepID=UPI0032ED360D
MDLASLKTVKNESESRFELFIGEDRAIIDFKVGKSGAIYLVHTEVPDKLEGQGVGHKLVRESLDILEHEGAKIIPLCPFVRSFLKDNLDDYKHMFAEGVKL